MSNMSKELLREYIKEQNFTSPNEILNALKDMFRDVLQESLEAEMDEALGYGKYDSSSKSIDNSRNGYSKKTVKSELGPVEINIPRDRNGEFEPKIISKHQRSVNGIEEKILGLYATGMTTRDISEQVKELYGVDVSAETVSNITNRILPLVAEWQSRPLEKTYSFVFMDAIHYKVREDKQVVIKAAYVVIGVNLDGEKEVLGIWIGANESSKFWLSVLNDLKNRGVQNVLIFCVDGLNGFKEAIGATFPFAKIQRCIIHQIRSSMKYIPYKDRKAFIADLKGVYTSVNEEIAMDIPKYIIPRGLIISKRKFRIHKIIYRLKDRCGLIKMPHLSLYILLRFFKCCSTPFISLILFYKFKAIFFNIGFHFIKTPFNKARN